MSFNSKKLGALQPREKRYVLTLDKGLTLRVHPSGKKSFVLRICQNGKIKDVTLGHLPDLSLAKAKALARRKQKQYAVDPVSGYTVNDAYRLWKNLKRGRIVSYKDEEWIRTTGAFSHENKITGQTLGGSQWGGGTVNFSAESYDPIYRDNSTIQPSSNYAFIIIKA